MGDLVTAAVSLVAVNFHGSSAARRLVESALAQTDPAWRLVLIDNSSDTAELSRLRTLAHGDGRIRVQPAPGNLGYFGAAHWWSGRTDAELTPWTVVCNVDVELASDFVAQLSRTDRGQFVTAPAITSVPEGRPQNPYLIVRPTARSMLTRSLAFRWRPVARAYIRAARLTGGRSGSPATRQAREIYAPHGSVIAIHRRFFESGGDLRHPTFLFNEELTIAERVRTLGGAVRFEPAVRAQHHQHQATGVHRSDAILAMQRDAARFGYRLIRAGQPQ